MKLFLNVLCIILIMDGVLSECPKLDDLPVLNDAGNEFYCAWQWQYRGDTEPIRACNGPPYVWMDNIDFTSGAGAWLPAGSIMVKAGCTLYGYDDYNYQGWLIKYYGPATFPDGCSGGACPNYPSPYVNIANGLLSIQCRCDQDPIICQPTDNWKTIMQCDNTQSSSITTCTYRKSIGTTWSASTTNSFSIDTSVEMAMKDSFFGLMEETLTVTGSTGYDWSHMSSESKSETITYQVSTEVQPYTLLQIQGAEGNCGGENVKTELFKFITVDPEGNILSEKMEKFHPHEQDVIILSDKKELTIE